MWVYSSMVYGVRIRDTSSAERHGATDGYLKWGLVNWYCTYVMWLLLKFFLATSFHVASPILEGISP